MSSRGRGSQNEAILRVLHMPFFDQLQSNQYLSHTHRMDIDNACRFEIDRFLINPNTFE